MIKFGKLSALLLALVFCLSLLPGGAWAEGEEPAEPIFFAAMMSKAGARDVGNSVVGAEWLGYAEKLGEDDFFTPAGMKTRLMLTAMDLRDPDAAFFIPESLSANGFSYHELTLFSHQELDPASIELTGVQYMGEIVKHVVGDADSLGNDGRVWWYTVGLCVPGSDFDMELRVGGVKDGSIRIIHPAGEGDSMIALFTTMQVYDYAETEPGVFDSVTLRVSGFNLPDDPQYYLIGDAHTEDAAFYAASTVTAEDDYGYRYVTFDFDGAVTAQDFIWWGLRFDHITFYPNTEYEFRGYDAWFFDQYNDVIYHDDDDSYTMRWDYGAEGLDGEWDPIFWLQGVRAEVASPYYCIFKTPDGGEQPPQPPVSKLAFEARTAEGGLLPEPILTEGGYTPYDFDPTTGEYIAREDVDLYAYTVPLSLQRLTLSFNQNVLLYYRYAGSDDLLPWFENGQETVGSAQYTVSVDPNGDEDPDTIQVQRPYADGTSEVLCAITFIYEDEPQVEAPENVWIGEAGTDVVDGDNVTYWKRADTYMGIIPAEATDDWNVRYEPMTDWGVPRLTLRNFNYTGAGMTCPFPENNGHSSAVIWIHKGDALVIAFEGENLLQSTGGANYFRHCIHCDRATTLTFIGGEDDVLTVSPGPDNNPTYAISDGISAGAVDVEGGTVIADGTRFDQNSGISLQWGGYVHVRGGKLITKGTWYALRPDSGNASGISTEYTILEDTAVLVASPNMDGSDPVPFVHDDIAQYKYLEFVPASELPAVPGDLDGNGRVEKADVIVLFVKISTAAPENLPDLTGDGCVNSRDALLLFRRTAQ